MNGDDLNQPEPSERGEDTARAGDCLIVSVGAEMDYGTPQVVGSDALGYVARLYQTDCNLPFSAVGPFATFSEAQAARIVRLRRNVASRGAFPWQRPEVGSSDKPEDSRRWFAAPA